MKQKPNDGSFVPGVIAGIAGVVFLGTCISIGRHEAHQDARIQQLRWDVKQLRFTRDNDENTINKLYSEVHPEKCAAMGPGWGLGCAPQEKPAWETSTVKGCKP